MRCSLLPDARCSGPHQVSQGKVRRFVQAMARGDAPAFPPVRLVDYGALGLQIIDGHHRVQAAKLAGVTISAVVVQGDAFEQLDLDLRDAGGNERADHAKFWQ